MEVKAELYTIEEVKTKSFMLGIVVGIVCSALVGTAWMATMKAMIL